MSSATEVTPKIVQFGPVHDTLFPGGRCVLPGDVLRLEYHGTGGFRLSDTDCWTHTGEYA